MSIQIPENNEVVSEPPADLRAARRRFLIILAIVIGFSIYSYGWTVTEIDLDKPQEELRQENVGNALRDLLSPRIFERSEDAIVERLNANFLFGCENLDDGAAVEQPEAHESGATIRITPDCGEEGDTVFIEVEGFEPNADTRIRWDPGEGQERPREVQELGREEILLDGDGSFSGTIEVPPIRGSDGETHQISVRSAIPQGNVVFSEMADLVFDAMLQTIFMALVATSVAIPIAGVLSFFAARNLMKPIRLSMGTMLASFIALAIGLWLGSMILKPVVDLGVDIGKADVTLRDDSDSLDILRALVALAAAGCDRCRRGRLYALCGGR